MRSLLRNAELGADTAAVLDEIKAATGHNPILDMDKLQDMVVDAIQRRKKAAASIDATLEKFSPFEDELERAVYKKVLKRHIGHLFGSLRKEHALRGRFAPFAPR